MSKHINPSVMYPLPSGQKVHPCRLIQRDGTLMWKHALIFDNEVKLPTSEAHEAHIQKTAQRLEELNSWISHDLEPWNCLSVVAWYSPEVEELAQGICVYFKHSQLDNTQALSVLTPHIQDHEILEVRGRYLYFKRC